jgi:DNA helicase IV
MSLASLMNAVESAHDLTLVGDIGQSISSDEQFIGWERLKEVWQIELGERATFFTLNVSYRSTLPIMQLASYASKRRSPTEGRAGRTPIWFHCENEERATESALQWLSKALERYPTSLSAVLCADQNEAQHVLSLLKPRLGAQVRIGKPGNFSFEEGLIVTAIEYVKGLEFTNVLLWNPSAGAFPAGDPLANNKLYVAITRAEENLALVSFGRYSRLLPPIDSKLVRGYDYRALLDD